MQDRLQKGDLVRVDMPHNSLWNERRAIVEGPVSEFDPGGETCYFVRFPETGIGAIFTVAELVRIA